MAALTNDAGSMRLTLRLVQQEAMPAATAPGGGQPVPAGRFLATASVEHFDRRDGDWWPFVRLPALYVAAEAVEQLVQGARQLLAGGLPGFSWQSAEGGPLALQLGDAPGGQMLVEVGADLGRWLADMAGTAPSAPPGSSSGAEACLFRFTAVRAELVRFADALGAEARAGGGA